MINKSFHTKNIQKNKFFMLLCYFFWKHQRKISLHYKICSIEIYHEIQKILLLKHRKKLFDGKIRKKNS